MSRGTVYGVLLDKLDAQTLKNKTLVVKYYYYTTETFV